MDVYEQLSQALNDVKKAAKGLTAENAELKLDRELLRTIIKQEFWWSDTDIDTALDRIKEGRA